jgi:ribosomal protein L37AE/L43A
MAAHQCESCGKPYYRRNLTEVWDKQNAGHRDGWHKATLRICTNCQGTSQSQRMLLLASTTISKDVKVRRHLAPVRDIREARVRVLKRRAG